MNRTMSEAHTGGLWAYLIYLFGTIVGLMSPQEWLVALSLVAVILRIVIDLPKFISVFVTHRPVRSVFAWLRDQIAAIREWFR